MSVPFSRTEPPVGRTMPRIVCTVLVLPQPDSPTSAIISPRFRLKLTPSTACTQLRGRRAAAAARPRRTG